MEFKVSTPPYTHQPNTSVSLMMHQVLYALLPGFAAYIWFWGWGLVIQVLLASVTALTCETFILWLRRRPLRPFLTDGSALVTAWLFAAALSPYAPWWVTAVGMVWAMIFAKHLYGGLGHNLFNPAMVGYAVMLISFPAEMSRWPALVNYHGFLDSLNIVFAGHPLSGVSLDALSSATPLDTVRTGLKQFYTLSEIQTNPIFGYVGGRGLEWVAGAFGLGGSWLIYQRTITWHIPVAVLGSLFLVSGLFFLGDPSRYPSPLFHLFTGGTMLGAFFIATDPVTAATSLSGRLFYGAGVGLLIYVIRTWGGYPDGVAFAVLLMNLVAPTIDYYTRPRVFGQ